MKIHYQTPTRGRGLAKWGSIIYLSVNSIFIVAFVVFLEFVDLSSGAVTPESSEDTLGVVLASSAMFFTVVQHVSLLMILGALFSRKYRSSWFYYTANVSSVFMLCSLGGPILAIVVSRYLHHNRAEFFGGLSATPPPLPVSCVATNPATSAALSPTTDASGFAAILEENQRLKVLVADQALQLQERNSR